MERSFLSYVSDIFFVSFYTDTHMVVAICGGKNVGKSSLARILVNTLLNRWVIFMQQLPWSRSLGLFINFQCTLLSSVQVASIFLDFPHLVNMVPVKCDGILNEGHGST